MPTHVRTQIRLAVVARLMNLLTTQDRVYSGRTRALAKSLAPTLLVYAIEEQVTVDAMSGDSGLGAILERTLTLGIEGRVSVAGPNASADLEDTLDRIQMEVEPVMVNDPLLGGLAREVTLMLARLNPQSPGENHAGEIRMDYRVVYRTREKVPHVAV